MALARTVTGLVLLAYLTTHFLNHALGLVSLAAMEAGRPWFLLLWRSALGTVLLYGSLVTHFGLALRSLYRRRHLRLAAWEATQLLLGLAIPPLLATHITATRIAWAIFDAPDTYARVVIGFWIFRQDMGVLQILLVVIAWTHGCVGLHFWLRLKPWYRRRAPWLFATALLLPVLALLGASQAGKEVARLAREPAWLQATVLRPDPRSAADRVLQERIRDGILAAVGASLGVVLLARAARRLHERRRVVRVTYPGGRQVTVPLGTTVLEASRFAGIPHASVCGGRARCSTCRVRVIEGAELLPPASAVELRVLRRVGAAPSIRLACQLRPTRDLSVTPLLSASAGPADALGHTPGAGREQEVTVLFADLRGFTQIAERRLPYDVVFLLNQYFAAVGGAITRSGGLANQFTGDGVMALFGVERGLDAGARQALAAAREIVLSLQRLSATLAAELRAPFRIGIGVHCGPAVVGRMGFGETEYLTAVGDTVHVASRLEQLTKEYGCELVVSEAVALRAGLDVSAFPRHEAMVRNRQEPLAIRVIADAGALALPAGAPTAARRARSASD
jgi:adenylate cyclase